MTKIIGDFCSNHLGDRRLIEHGIKTLAKIGVDIIKFQSFKADKLTKDWPDYQTAYEYYKSVELSDDDHAFIIEKCEEYGIEPLFTAFGLKEATFLQELGVEKVKIASPDMSNDHLIRHCRGRFKTIYISTGMHTDKEIELVRRERKGQAAFLYCISKYPTKYEEIDFDKMQMFDGFSDHTADLRAAKKAIDLSIPLIERHFTLGKWLPGNDHKISSTPDEFRELVEYRDYKAKCDLYKRRWQG